MTGSGVTRPDPSRCGEVGDPDLSPALPGWVLQCWTRSWRDSYGDEMADTWADCDGTRRGLVRLAGRGLWLRVARPRAAVEDLDGDQPRAFSPANPFVRGDAALVARPPMLLRTLVGMATAFGLLSFVLLPALTAFIQITDPTLIERAPAFVAGRCGPWRTLGRADDRSPRGHGGTGRVAGATGTSRDQGLGLIVGAAAVVGTPLFTEVLDWLTP
jgi:hypothetical protein